MDTVLARTFSVRPENKLAMKCPSWPDTPLHQYFGAKRSNRKNMDFVLSSLGYIRLYQCCCPCERGYDQPDQDSGYGSSFVHLEERMRSDGPFTLYRRPQRRLGLGLTERAREKRLLRYYKYFQGFQRKLQVSRQFEQNSQKTGNKAKVNEIINCYKPNRQSPAGTSALTPSHSKEQNTVQTEEHLSVPTTAKRVTLDKEHPKSEASAKNDKERSRGKNAIKVQFATTTGDDLSTTNEMSDMAAALSFIDSNASKFHKKKERSTIIVPTLATIEEGTDDCELSESNENVNLAKNRSILSLEKPDLVENKQFHEKAEIKPRLSSENKGPLRLQGILKHPKPRSYGHSSKSEASSCLESLDLQTKDQMPMKRKPRKFPRAKKTSADLVISQTLSSDGQLTVSKEGSLKQVVSRSKRRARPPLQRSNHSASETSFQEESPGQDDSELSVLEQKGQANAVKLHGQNDSQSTLNSSSGKSSKKMFKVQKKPKPFGTSKGKLVVPGNIISFTGWDLGTRLAAHTFKTLPEEKDLSQQLLQRIENITCEDDEQKALAKGVEPLPKETNKDQQDVKSYLLEHSIEHVFEHMTEKLVLQHHRYPMELLRNLSHNLSVQHDQQMNINEDLNYMRENPTPKSVCTNNVSDNFPKGKHDNKANNHFRRRNIPTMVKTDSQAEIETL